MTPQLIDTPGCRPPGSSSGVTNTGPAGVVATNVLPCNHSLGAELPVPHGHVVEHGEPGDGAFRPVLAGAAHDAADHDGELGLPVDSVGPRRQLDVVAGADQRLGELGEQRRVLGQVATHLQDVAAIVRSDELQLLVCQMVTS